MQERNSNTDYFFWLPLVGGLVLFFLAALNTPPSPPILATSTESPVDLPSTGEMLADGGLDQTIDFWEGIIEVEPENGEAYYQLGLLFAITDPKSAGSYLNNAAELDNQYEDKSAQIIRVLRLVEFSEREEYQLIQVGQVLGSVEEWALAREAFSRATTINPNYGEAWAFLGEAETQLNEDPSDSFETALSIDPKSFSVNFFLGLFWLRNDDPAKALEFFATADEIDPENKIVLTNIAYGLFAIGQTNDAIAQFQNIVELDRNDIFSWLTLAEFSIQNEIQVEIIGIEAARKALLIDKNNIKANALLGRAYTLLGDRVLSRRFLQKAVELNGNDAMTHYYLALHFLSLEQNSEKAMAYLEKTIELGKNQIWALQASEILKQFTP
ncbi:MAG: hypothetical protein HON98_03485 [Chloroflexi bacterium]|jgi:tetratricopeptide (TPR) repeat protein|nr:hypothetical protein [Chloroflexota bacterium]MBT3670421.1 hypothetical protein [Chloroflexota bacterium]MBT4304677.1 hypothetical protein [Chloroflexota bacterium]MBT4532567.1 hypothetical protein [Chloroflexota bacterium]MBT4681998.1 hypothetical protein [Chloroflexota bacterium]